MSSEVLNFTINVFWFWSWASAHLCFRTPANSVTTHWVRMCHKNILIANVISNEAARRESRIHGFPLSPVQMESNRYFFKELKLMAPLPERQTAAYSWDCPSTHPGIRSVQLSPLSTLPSLEKINHRSQLMSPIMASCDCPFIIPLIISIIIIIISSLQFITPCPKEDGIMFQIWFFFLICGFFQGFSGGCWLLFLSPCRWWSSQAAVQLWLQPKKKKKNGSRVDGSCKSENQPGLQTGGLRFTTSKCERSYQSVISQSPVCLIWEKFMSAGLHSLRNKSGTNFRARVVGNTSNPERLFTGKMPHVSTVAVQTTVGCLCSFPPTGNQTARVAYSGTQADARFSQQGRLLIPV